eukprot:gene17102-12240_t
MPSATNFLVRRYAWRVLAEASVTVRVAEDLWRTHQVQPTSLAAASSSSSSAVSPLALRQLALRPTPASHATVELVPFLLTGAAGRRWSSASASPAVDRYPFVLTSLSCATADWLVKKYLPAHRDVFLTLQQQLQQPSQPHVFGGDDTTDNDASWTRDLFQAAETLFGVDASFQSRLATIASSAAVRVNAPSRAVSVLLKQEAFAAPSTTVAASPVSLMDSVDSKTVDVAGVVVTSVLIAHHGLDTIFDVLHREGLVVVNSVTTKLTMAVVKTLSEAAGMSSLTLKPSNQTMLTGPVV